LRKNGFKVSDKAYFVYCNGKKNKDKFYKRLSFDIVLIPYLGNDSWIDTAIDNLYKYLNSDEVPLNNENCEFCDYARNVKNKVK